MVRPPGLSTKFERSGRAKPVETGVNVFEKTSKKQTIKKNMKDPASRN